MFHLCFISWEAFILLDFWGNFCYCLPLKCDLEIRIGTQQISGRAEAWTQDPVLDQDSPPPRHEVGRSVWLCQGLGKGWKILMHWSLRTNHTGLLLRAWILPRGHQGNQAGLGLRAVTDPGKSGGWIWSGRTSWRRWNLEVFQAREEQGQRCREVRRGF